MKKSIKHSDYRPIENDDGKHTLENYYKNALASKEYLEKRLRETTDRKEISFIKSSLACTLSTIDNLKARLIIW